MIYAVVLRYLSPMTMHIKGKKCPLIKYTGELVRKYKKDLHINHYTYMYNKKFMHGYVIYDDNEDSLSTYKFFSKYQDKYLRYLDTNINIETITKSIFNENE